MKRLILMAASAAVMIALLYFAIKHATSVNQVVQMDNAMAPTQYENDSVTVDIIKANTWRLVAKSHIDQHSQHVWKLKSGNYVIRFNYMPDNKYYKWNVGEVVPNELVLELLAVDELIHETYNLHVERQR